MNQLEKIAQLWNSDVEGFEKFADLVEITAVVKLQVNGCKGELGEGTLHTEFGSQETWRGPGRTVQLLVTRIEL